MLWQAKVDRLPEDRTGRGSKLNSETAREQAKRDSSRPIYSCALRGRSWGNSGSGSRTNNDYSG
jgi:hypothetical protein